MNILIFGISHKNTPIEVREQLYLNPTKQDLLLSELKSNPAIVEASVLSTCNRIEIYVHVLDVTMDLTDLVKLVFKINKVSYTDELSKYFYMYSGEVAVRHLLEVACGLDSLVLGEEQILGQVKSAFTRARELGMLGRQFNILANTAIRAGKKARHETNINLGGSSVSWAAIAKAEEVLGDLADRSILVIGAGKMSELAVGHIQNKKFKNLYLMNRTQDNAHSLAEKYGGEVVPFCDMKEVLSQVDICICSAGAPHYILEKDIVRRIMGLRDHKQLLFIDISMPRNIDPHVAEIENVLLYQIDDLNEVVDANMQQRKNAVERVKMIIDEKLADYCKKLRKLSAQHETNPRNSLETFD